MRRIFSTVLVLMLVLRGLLGDAMAMGMMPVLTSAAPAHAEVQQQHDSHNNAAHAHHEEGAAAVGHCSSGDAQAQSTQHCSGSTHYGVSCSACDICNSTLHTSDELVLNVASTPQSLVIDKFTRFVSAQPAQVAKPPIS